MLSGPYSCPLGGLSCSEAVLGGSRQSAAAPRGMTALAGLAMELASTNRAQGVVNITQGESCGHMRRSMRQWSANGSGAGGVSAVELRMNNTIKAKMLKIP